jgi:hypothetical protein
MDQDNTLTVKLDTSALQDAIDSMFEPGAVLLPASAVAELASRYGVKLIHLLGAGGVTAKAPGQ